MASRDSRFEENIRSTFPRQPLDPMANGCDAAKSSLAYRRENSSAVELSGLSCGTDAVVSVRERSQRSGTKFRGSLKFRADLPVLS